MSDDLDLSFAAIVFLAERLTIYAFAPLTFPCQLAASLPNKQECGRTEPGRMFDLGAL